MMVSDSEKALIEAGIVYEVNPHRTAIKVEGYTYYLSNGLYLSNTSNKGGRGIASLLKQIRRDDAKVSKTKNK